MTAGNRLIQRSTLIASSLAVVVVMLNVAAVNPALPSLQQAFQTSTTDLQWVVNVYNIVFAALLLVGGLLGARLGFRRVLLGGLALGAFGAVLTALAPSYAVVLLGRGITGVGASLVQPATLVLLTLAFSDPAARARAIGLWAGVSGLGIAVGPVLGGVLVDAFGWTAVFWTLVLAGAVTWAASLWGTRESPRFAARRVDLPGLLLVVLTLGSLIYGLTQGNGLGWGSPLVLGCLLGAGVLFALFLWVEGREQHPLVDLGLFRNLTFTASNLGGLLIFFGPFSLLVFFTLLLQGVMRYSATRAGLIIVFFPLGAALGSVLGGHLTARRGTRLTATLGLGLIGLATLVLVRVSLRTTGWDLWWNFAVMGLGVGLSLGALTTAAMASAPRDQMSQASSLLSALRQVGAALGIALLGAVIALHPGEDEAAFLGGLRDALWLAGGVLLLSAPAVWWAMGRPEGEGRPAGGTLTAPVQDAASQEG
ncbi:putative major facilitator superfamily; putative membrane family (plasmid) [Deinococcus deserti VCD115]|uniref:Putative major facilitator superfamily putative membrane family n=2 Tax=Deinococcus TaxID=1298 RepID=C1D3L0_DEIDV|nr:MFS transporter [Deinococcus deserti]ACO48089.1 putative major facilitator superfamily; putative membrane family [Deinococcus deserti VCD115]